MNFNKKIFAFIKQITVSFMVMFMVVQSTFSQELKKDVTVVKSYQPVISDANKINIMPVFKDTVAVIPHFEYSIYPVQLNSIFHPRPVNAAKMAQEPLPILYNNYLKLGIGNHLATITELHISNSRSKTNSYSLVLSHHGIDGKVILDNNKKADAPFMFNEADFYGKHIFKESELSGEVGYLNNKVAFYGYNPKLDTSLNRNSVIQEYQGAKAKLSLESLEKDSLHLHYKITGGYDYLADKFKNSENHVSIDAMVSKKINDWYMGCEITYDDFFPGSLNDSAHNNLLNMKPFLSKAKANWRFTVGLNGASENKFYTYPYIDFQFAVVPSVLHFFIGYYGFIEQNSLTSIIGINPFVLPGLQFKNSNHKSYFYGGLKGNISSNIHFMANANYSVIDNQYFFINDTSGRLGNHFLVVYDNIEIFKIFAEFDIKASDKLSILAKGNFSSYTMFKQEKPWEMPQFDATLTARYNLRKKILLTGGLFISGSRFALDPSTHKTISLSPYADFNLGLEYRYTKILSLFLQIKNLTAARYSWWNQYPVYRFQITGGFTYAL